MNTPPASSTRYTADSQSDRATAGIRRVVVPTALGDVVAHVDPYGAALSETATLLLHGAAGSWTTWLPLIRASHKAGTPLRNVVALDLPGWGESGSISADATVEDLADAVAHVTRTLGYARWDIFGHSLGGHVGLTIAARHPEHTASVTAISATGPGALSVLRHPIRNFGVLPALAGMLGAMRLLSALGAGGTALVRALHRVRLLGLLSDPLFAHRRSLDSSVIDSLAAEIRPTSFARGAAAAARYNETQWASIRCPVIFVRGDHDVFVSSADDAWFRSVIPHASQQVSPNTGHFAHIESLQGLHSARGGTHAAA
ncbi:alpha/beta fold hydrolase [Mycetocola miduiensis]|uniref:Pimeloyl-ACP methyl ester carboxylesterase n=1 Tax=Mycetocola miduiensis TaxID=995034 RepID=A0A1I5C6H0_9MICO|nr:alpha/beta hydrolase [Mycetocola miduiensis]SFN82527.1 Pimeloyl-ACP methyl ester carboxylesterase [Mycetocola miduiensis]